MAYLVQRQFTNNFKDFKLTQAEYFTNIDDIEPIETLGFESYWKGDLSELESEDIYQRLESLGVEVFEKENTFVVCIPYMKVWELVDGQPVTANKAVGYYWFNNEWVPARIARNQIRKTLDEIVG